MTTLKVFYEFGRALCLSVAAMALTSALLPSMNHLRFPLWSLIPVVAAGIWYVLDNVTYRMVVNVAANTAVKVSDMAEEMYKSEIGQDVAEYAVMLAVILVIVVGTIRMIGSHASNIFSSVGSAMK